MGFGALADKSLPSRIADAEDEVAAAFKGILKSLTGNVAGPAKNLVNSGYQSTWGRDAWRRFGKAGQVGDLISSEFGGAVIVPSQCGWDASTTAAETAALRFGSAPANS